jgi:hypothetical protein
MTTVIADNLPFRQFHLTKVLLREIPVEPALTLALLKLSAAESRKLNHND